jgi:hypothetical protein
MHRGWTGNTLFIGAISVGSAFPDTEGGGWDAICNMPGGRAFLGNVESADVAQKMVQHACARRVKEMFDVALPEIEAALNKGPALRRAALDLCCAGTWIPQSEGIDGALYMNPLRAAVGLHPIPGQTDAEDDPQVVD